jgi:hypothetical protein
MAVGCIYNPPMHPILPIDVTKYVFGFTNTQLRWFPVPLRIAVVLLVGGGARAGVVVSPVKTNGWTNHFK